MTKDEMIKRVRVLLASAIRGETTHAAVADYAAALASLTGVESEPAAVLENMVTGVADASLVPDSEGWWWWGDEPVFVMDPTGDGLQFGLAPNIVADVPSRHWRGRCVHGPSAVDAPPVDSMRTAGLAADAVLDRLKRESGFADWWYTLGGSGIEYLRGQSMQSVRYALAADTGPDAEPDPATPPDETIDRLFAEDAEARSRDDRPGAPSEWLPSERIPTAKDVQELRAELARMTELRDNAIADLAHWKDSLRADLARMTARKDEALAERDQTAQDMRGIMAQRDRLRERAREDEDVGRQLAVEAASYRGVNNDLRAQLAAEVERSKAMRATVGGLYSPYSPDYVAGWRGHGAGENAGCHRSDEWNAGHEDAAHIASFVAPDLGQTARRSAHRLPWRTTPPV